MIKRSFFSWIFLIRSASIVSRILLACIGAGFYHSDCPCIICVGLGKGIGINFPVWQCCDCGRERRERVCCDDSGNYYY